MDGSSNETWSEPLLSGGDCSSSSPLSSTPITTTTPTTNNDCSAQTIGRCFYNTIDDGPAEDDHNDDNPGDDDEDDATVVVAEEEEGPIAVPGTPNPWRNHNVIVSLLLCIVSGTADSIWSSVVLSGFLLALANHSSMGGGSSLGGGNGSSNNNNNKRANTLVGTAEAVQGLAQLLSALPIGYLADAWSKSKTMRLGGGLMLGTIAWTLWVLLDIHQWVANEEDEEEDNSSTAHRKANQSYILLVVALGFWGVVNGISYGPSQALFADSIPRGQRSAMLTWLYACYLLSSAVGPLVGIVVLLTASSSADDWSIAEILPVFFLGICLEIPAAILMFFFSDAHVVPEGSSAAVLSASQTIEAAAAEPCAPGEAREPLLLEHPPTTAMCIGGDDDKTPPCTDDCSSTFANGNDDAGEEQVGLLNTVDGSTSMESSYPAIGTRNRNKKALIPYVIFISSLISSLGSGASVKYFPLFFKQVGFGSAAVQGIFLLVPISISGFSFVAQVAGKRMGRIEATVLSIVLGVALLFCMTALSHDVSSSSNANPDDDSATTTSLWQDNPHRALAIVVVYLLRTGVINCSYPLLESVLMDTVASNQRARWKSLESIASFGWTGSALLGGILSDTHSYQFTFTMTAWMQLASGLPLLIIQPWVEVEGTHE